ncbi:MAG: hypothetical protein IKP36_01895 [Bacteroidaceae bacterium]|nr:hypothetical protein [Bacteroidaceae bacterium]
MSESHLQVNLDGSTANRKTVLWPSSKREQETIIRGLFEHNNWKVSEISNQSGSFWKIITSCNDKTFRINLYISSVRDEDRQPDEFKMQLGNTYPEHDEKGWITLVLGIYTIAEGSNKPKYILSGYDRNRYDFSTNPSIRGTRTAGLQKAYTYGMFKTERSILFRPEFIYYYIEYTESLFGNNVRQESSKNKTASIPTTKQFYDYLIAIRTIPFLLLAGISGTGKSRIVRELAFKSCPEYLQDKDGTTPGNYCMIEVKPNWHDSTELLGYYSNMNKSYQFKKFLKFLVKAKMNPEVPFFVCLDEMNLAPVEHYFAEMLSIMETRKHPKKEGTDEVNIEVIKTGVIVESQYYKEVSWKDNDGINHQKIDMSDKDWYEHFFDASIMSEGEKEQIQKYQYSRTLQTEGLTLPDNVIIIGTVNMDDTTHQFSRKVIDRAMTIEMNGGKLSNMFGGSKDLEYLPKEEQEKWQNSFRQLYVNADEVLEAHKEFAKEIIEKVPEKLENINTALKGTPFEVSYRVLNELTIMVGVMLDNNEEGESIDDVINQALDRILLMKILPRIEGDSDMFNLHNAVNIGDKTCHNRLEWLYELAPDIKHKEQEGDDHQQTAREKIKEMMDRLKNQDFTRFWP